MDDGNEFWFVKFLPCYTEKTLDQLKFEVWTVPLPETKMVAENWWLAEDPFFLERPIFGGELLVLGSVFRNILELRETISKVFFLPGLAFILVCFAGMLLMCFR